MVELVKAGSRGAHEGSQGLDRAGGLKPGKDRWGWGGRPGCRGSMPWGGKGIGKPGAGRKIGKGMPPLIMGIIGGRPKGGTPPNPGPAAHAVQPSEQSE